MCSDICFRHGPVLDFDSRLSQFRILTAAALKCVFQPRYFKVACSFVLFANSAKNIGNMW